MAAVLRRQQSGVWEVPGVGGRQRQTFIKERSDHLGCSGCSRAEAGGEIEEVDNVGEAPRCQAGPKQRPLAIHVSPLDTHSRLASSLLLHGTHTRTEPSPELTDPRLLSWDPPAATVIITPFREGSVGAGLVEGV